MKIAIVGITRPYKDIPPDYVDTFNKFHLELPFYFARDGHNRVDIITVDHSDDGIEFPSGGHLQCLTVEQYRDLPDDAYDVVIHWRKWNQSLHKKGVLGVLHTCDHSYDAGWKSAVFQAFQSGDMGYILCYETWHQQNTFQELEGCIPMDRLITKTTLGVDTDIYHPEEGKDPHHLLWASDPGRGLLGTLQVITALHRLDKRFHLDVTYPDYVNKDSELIRLAARTPGTTVRAMSNGPELWSTFNRSGITPYTCTFKEPSSRVHRQSMAAGSLLLYPPDMGSPSQLVIDGKTGYVQPVENWVRLIMRSVVDGSWKQIGDRAREFAISENWAVNAARFNGFFSDKV